MMIKWLYIFSDMHLSWDVLRKNLKFMNKQCKIQYFFQSIFRKTKWVESTVCYFVTCFPLFFTIILICKHSIYLNFNFKVTFIHCTVFNRIFNTFLKNACHTFSFIKYFVLTDFCKYNSINLIIYSINFYYR